VAEFDFDYSIVSRKGESPAEALARSGFFAGQTFVLSELVVTPAVESLFWNVHMTFREEETLPAAGERGVKHGEG
jgi:hypothetical protein